MLRKYKSFLTSLFAAAVVGIIFLGYLILIGIPKTNARNLYNQGVESIKHGDIAAGEDYFEQAIVAWPEGYIVEELENLRNL